MKPHIEDQGAAPTEDFSTGGATVFESLESADILALPLSEGGCSV